MSLLFLLIADDKVRSKILLQQLIVASFSKEQSTLFLRTWAKEESSRDSDWRDKLLEGLCIIQAKRVIAKLGISFYDLDQRFLPSNAQSSLFIHPIVKLLYFVCEELSAKECKALVAQVSATYSSVSDFNYSDDGEHLELYLMHWMWQQAIDIGSREEDARASCNLGPIIAHLKQIERDCLTETVKSVSNKFNSFEQKIHTDDKRASNIEAASLTSAIAFGVPSTSKHCYSISRGKAGVVLIINQMHFSRDDIDAPLLSAKPLETRHGTDQDTTALSETFSGFGYRIIVRENIVHSEMLTAVRDAVNQSVPLDSIVVCILSHGYKGIVYGADSIPVAIEDIEKILCTDRLIGKPKILIIQACQGEETQQAKMVQLANRSETETSIKEEISIFQIDPLRHDGPPTPSLPAFSDTLTCISTVPGFTSIRHIEQGSWFIQTLCAKLRELAAQKHFADILTVVCREVISKRGRNNQCMVPIYHSTLHLDLYLPAN